MPEVTFFMIVTARDAVIADYAIRSYSKIVNLDYQLAVYSNYLLVEQKRHYFPRWASNRRVSIIENAHHDERLQSIWSDIGPGRREGPSEPAHEVWDRELEGIGSPYIATVDPDFEIIRPDFIQEMMDTLRRRDDLIGFSTDFSSGGLVFDSYSQRTLLLHECNNTWFCIYRKLAFNASSASHAYQDNEKEGQRPIQAWDDAALFQQDLRSRGFHFLDLGGRYPKSYVHYFAFSKNSSLTRRTVVPYRYLVLLEMKAPRALSSIIGGFRRLVHQSLANDRSTYVYDAPIKW